jgi:energy-coupling factor transport system substrate-specific component
MSSLAERQRFIRIVTFTAVCIALNVGLGKIANILSLPFSMDTVGTVLSVSLLPWYGVLLVAGLSSVVASVMINPVFIYYIGTQLAIGLVAILLVRVNGFSTYLKSILSGLLIGIVSAVVSTPVTAIIFGGVTVPGVTALNVLFLASGKSLWESVIKGALIVESLDKMAAGIFVHMLLKRIKNIV